MQKALEKGVPSLFSDLKGLSKDQEKQKLIESVALELKDHYEAQDESKLVSFAPAFSRPDQSSLERLGGALVDLLLYRSGTFISNPTKKGLR